jgi:beta-galactosidase
MFIKSNTGKFILLLVSALILIGTTTHAQSLRKKISFDDGWKFHLGNAANPKKDFNYGAANLFWKAGAASNTPISKGFKDSGWQQVTVPHDWVVILPFEKSNNKDLSNHGFKTIGSEHPENTIGWYRKSFQLQPADSGNKYTIQFDGVFRDCKVFLNEHYLGGNFSGYSGFELDITDYLSFREKNVLTVRVDASQYEGWFYEGAGIYRHVWLNKTHPVHVASDGIFVYTPKVVNNVATVTNEITVQNEAYEGKKCTVTAFIIDKNGKQVAIYKPQDASLSVNEKKTLTFNTTVNNPTLWDLDNPYLYKLVALVKAEGKTIDSVVTKFGIRTIKIDNEKGFFLNGKSVKIKGTCNHQDHAGVGVAIPDSLQYYRIKLLKEMGSNAYRTTHHAPTPEVLDACDELGMLVLDENRLLGSSAEVMSQFTRLITRDRNHPSVFMWSLANEEIYAQKTDIGKRIALTLIAKQKELDPTRTCTYAANLGDVTTGVNQVIPIRGFNYFLNEIDAYRKSNPLQPTIGTEFASTVTTRGIYQKDTVAGYVPDYDPNNKSSAESWWTLTANRDWIMGGFAWTGFDYRGEPYPYRWPCINSHFGIMDMCGFPKNIYYYYQSWWSNKDVLRIYPHWNWKGKEGQPINVHCNSNAEEVELFLNDKSLGKKAMKKNSHLEWIVNYETGVLKAVAFKNGKRLEALQVTTSDAYEIIATPSKTTIDANGKDVVLINFTVKDKNGNEVPDAMNLLSFKISAGARIIGVGNGDPSSHEPDQFSDGNYQRKLFNGKCQVIIQCDKSGSIVVEGYGENLQTGKTIITAK